MITVKIFTACIETNSKDYTSIFHCNITNWLYSLGKATLQF